MWNNLRTSFTTGIWSPGIYVAAVAFKSDPRIASKCISVGDNKAFGFSEILNVSNPRLEFQSGSCEGIAPVTVPNGFEIFDKGDWSSTSLSLSVGNKCGLQWKCSNSSQKSLASCYK